MKIPLKHTPDTHRFQNLKIRANFNQPTPRERGISKVPVRPWTKVSSVETSAEGRARTSEGTWGGGHAWGLRKSERKFFDPNEVLRYERRGGRWSEWKETNPCNVWMFEKICAVLNRGERCAIVVGARRELVWLNVERMLGKLVR